MEIQPTAHMKGLQLGNTYATKRGAEFLKESTIPAISRGFMLFLGVEKQIADVSY